MYKRQTLYRETTFSAIIRKSDEELAQEESDAKENPKKVKKAEGNRGIPPITDLATGQALMERTMRITTRLIIHCILPMDGIDGEGRIERMSPKGIKKKPSKRDVYKRQGQHSLY